MPSGVSHRRLAKNDLTLTIVATIPDVRVDTQNKHILISKKQVSEQCCREFHIGLLQFDYNFRIESIKTYF